MRANKTIRGTLEYFVELAKQEGESVAKWELREQFKKMKQGKFEKLWTIVQGHIPKPEPMVTGSERKEKLYAELSLDVW